MKPSAYIHIDSKILGRFLKDDGYAWYPGVVTNINYIDKDTIDADDPNDTLVRCAIKYDDGEIADDVYLYDKDFENEWKFNNDNSQIIKHLYELSKDVEDLKSIVLSDDDYDILDYKKFKMQEIDSKKPDKVDDADETEDETEEDTEDDDKTEDSEIRRLNHYHDLYNNLSIIERTASIFVLMSTGCIGIALTYKILCSL